MILTCPACQTSYTVKDGAIPPNGRTVRCAACKHSWHQSADEALAAPEPIPQETPWAGEPGSTTQPAPEPAPGQAMVGDGSFVEPVARPIDENAEAIEQSVTDDALPQAAPAEESVWIDAPYGDDDAAPPRSKGLLIIGAVVLLISAAAAAAFFLAPREWMARAGLTEARGDSPLKLMVTSHYQQRLASGNSLYSLSGRVINSTDKTELVPSLRAELADAAGKIVYSWTIPPPAVRLAPQASATFNAAELGVPVSAKQLTLRWAS